MPRARRGRPSPVRSQITRCAGALAVFLLARATASGQAYTVLHEFSGRAGNPIGGLIHGSDGKLYGVLQTGGDGLGSIYSLTPDGSGGYTYADIYAMTAADGVIGLSGELLEAADGGLYGASYFPQGGVIYRVDSSGGLTVVHTLTGSDGGYPSELIQSAAGDLYGVGNSPPGTAFRIDTSGNFSVLHTFANAEGRGPVGPLLLASDGFLYGACGAGGGSSRGTIFRMDFSGAVTLLHDFEGPDGSNPSSALIEGTDGFLYGTTSAGGTSDLGTVFRISTSGTLTTLHSFAAGEGATPLGSLLQASDGKFYGTTYDGSGTLFRVDSAGGFSSLHTFSTQEGIAPQGALIEVGGQLVGTLYRGGASGYGAVFTSTPLGVVTVVQAFNGSPEGNFPAGGLLQASDGLIYGTASQAGDSGSGTLFRMDLAGNVTRLHSFDGPTEGADPQAALIEASDGNLYGTAGGGGGGYGTVFRSSTSGTVTLLHAFTQTDGEFLNAALLESTDGNLYGTTIYGGDANHGTAFQVDGTGGFARIHSFSADEGGYPSGFVQASDGGLYGATSGGSIAPSYVFRMDPSGSFTGIHLFDQNGNDANKLLIGTDGSFYAARRVDVYRLDPAGNFTTIHPFQYPDIISYPSELVEGPDGRLWGRGLGDGELYRGAVFRVDSNGNLTIAHRFLGPDGAEPYGRPMFASDGMLYGTTAYGGQFQGGVVYRIDPALVIDITSVAPESGPASGGASLTISGVNFQPGATVTVGFVPATNVVVSSSQITASAPALGAGAAYDVVVDNPDLSRATRSRAWVVDAADVSPADLYYDAVTHLFHSGVSVGCGNGLYCVDTPVSRSQMAVFLLKGKFGPYYTPPPATGTVFGDVPADAFAAAFIEDLSNRGISAGCGNGNYCPDDPITRAEMAPLLVKTLLGPGYTPPPATGTVFGDVAAGDFAADFIEDLAARDITAGCQTSPPLYCPGAETTRGQMAAFVISTFALP